MAYFIALFWLLCSLIFSIGWQSAYGDTQLDAILKTTEASIAAEEQQAQKEVNAINAALYAGTKRPPRSATRNTITSNATTYTQNRLFNWQSSDTTSSGSFWPVLLQDFSLDHNTDRPEVRHQILFYLSRRGVLNQMLNNAVPYIYYVYQQTLQRKMPGEFALLPLVESDYDPFAYSSAGATGLWQMMPGTMSSFGLDINWWYDSRRDTVIATQAALNFLCDLHSVLHEWLLAAAAYDVGVSAIQAAQQYNLRENRPTDFWTLPLPTETRNYVPKLLALAEIIQHADAYGVKLPPIPNRPYFAAINLNSQIDLAEVSRLTNVSIDIIHRLNPGMLRFATNPSSVYTLLVPYDKGKIFQENLKRLSQQEHISWQYHEIRSAETLESIAKNYHTNIALLKQVNGLTNENLPPNQGLLVPLHFHHTYGAPIVTANLDNTDNSNLKKLLEKIYSVQH